MRIRITFSLTVLRVIHVYTMFDFLHFNPHNSMDWNDGYSHIDWVAHAWGLEHLVPPKWRDVSDIPW